MQTPTQVHAGVLVAIALGGAAGALARFGLDRFVQSSLASTFPYGTLTVNLAGCFAIGFCFVALRSSDPVVRMGVTTGLLGGFTTFSTFSLDAIHLLENRSYGSAVAYVALSVAVGLVATIVGNAVARAVFD